MLNWKENLQTEIFNRNEVSRIIGDSDKFYVYILWKTYTKLPTPFYVGKGHFNRLLKHEMKSDENTNIYKTRVIKKHTKLGLEIGYSLHSFHCDELDALFVEKKLISLIGRADIKNGPLTNRTDGGDGTLGFLSPKGELSKSARAVMANGARYGCLKDAANSLNIHSAALVSRIKNGWLGYYYEDEGQVAQSKKILGRYAKKVVILGYQYESVSAASKKTGLDSRVISKRIKNGWDGYYFVEDGQKPRKSNWESRTDKVPVNIKGTNYSTIAEAVKITGESTSMISKRCLSSNFPEYFRLDGKTEKKSSKPKYPEAVVINSKVFDSLSEASKHFELTCEAIVYRCKSNNYNDWQFANQTKQQRESFTPQFSSTPVQVFIDGVYYDSQSSAARTHNVDINTLKQRCKSYSFPTWRSSSIKKVRPRNGVRSRIPISINGKEYRSISSASDQTGLSRAVISRRLKSTDWPEYIAPDTACFTSSVNEN